MSLSEHITRLIDRLYIRQVAAVVPRDTFRYAACGVVTYFLLDPLFYFVVYNFVVAHRFFDLGFVVISPHIASIAVVFPMTLFTGFWLNRNVAFSDAAGRQREQAAKYLLSILGSLLLTYIGMKFFVEWCGLWPTPAKVVTTVAVTLYSYIAARYFTFRKG